MDVWEIAKKYLVDNGFDGLVGDGCECPLSELMSCEDDRCLTCVPGHLEGYHIMPGPRPKAVESDTDKLVDQLSGRMVDETAPIMPGPRPEAGRATDRGE